MESRFGIHALAVFVERDRGRARLSFVEGRDLGFVAF
jgi:hypothetical protein